MSDLDCHVRVIRRVNILRTGTFGAQLGSGHVTELGNLLKTTTTNYCTDSVFYIVNKSSILKAHFNISNFDVVDVFNSMN